MTPKIIHCVWLGGAEKPPVVRKCMESWRRFCPGWEVREWGDADMARVSNRYAREADGRRQWAFASDYLRLKALNDFGGFYFDTDLELLKPIDEFLPNDFTTGFIDRSPDVLLNMCFLGAAKGCEFVADMLAEYVSLDFVLPDGELDQTPNVVRMARYLERRAGTRFADARARLELAPGSVIYPAEYFNSADGYAVHHYCASWLDDWVRKLYLSFGRHKLVRFKQRKGCSSAFPESLPGEEVVASLRLGPRRRLCITRYAGR
jgi:hypothetical protein